MSSLLYKQSDQRSNSTIWEASLNNSYKKIQLEIVCWNAWLMEHIVNGVVTIIWLIMLSMVYSNSCGDGLSSECFSVTFFTAGLPKN